MNKLIYKILYLINWKKKIFPVIIQNIKNNEILMLAWINKYSFLESFFFNKSCYWSRSNKKFWRKGESTGNIQNIKKIMFDCDIDSFIFKIIQIKNSCHYNFKKCFIFLIKN